MPIRQCCPLPIVKSFILSFVLLVSPVSIPGWCDAEQEISSRFERGVRYLDAEQYDLALAEFQAIEKEFGTSVEISSLAQYYIGFVHQELNDLSPAASAYQKALDIKSTTRGAWERAPSLRYRL